MVRAIEGTALCGDHGVLINRGLSSWKMITEVQLDHAFAEALEQQPPMQEWLLSAGRFSRLTGSSTLLVAEQETARRTANHWWKHWWCRLPDGSESETDIFLVFSAANSLRFALHIENKPVHGKLLIPQAADYRRRAAYKANNPKWLNYSDFETILLAPSAFIRRHPEETSLFDRSITYEEAASFAPLFGEALR